MLSLNFYKNLHALHSETGEVFPYAHPPSIIEIQGRKSTDLFFSLKEKPKRDLRSNNYQPKLKLVQWEDNWTRNNP